MAIRIDGCADPHRAESLAAREGLIFAWNTGFHHVILEGDAHNVYESIKGVQKIFLTMVLLLEILLCLLLGFLDLNVGLLLENVTKLPRILVCG